MRTDEPSADSFVSEETGEIDQRNRPIGYAEQCLWMPAIKIKNPGARGSVELLMHRSCIRDQFAGRRRTACWNQSPYWVIGQYLRLTPPNPVDPGPYLVIVANRHATGKLCWRAHPRQAMRSAEGGGGVFAKECAKNLLLSRVRIVQSGCKGNPRGTAGEPPQ